MTKLSETLCPKTGSNASNYIEITFFVAKSIRTAKGYRRREGISNNLNHFAGLFVSYCTSRGHRVWGCQGSCLSGGSHMLAAYLQKTLAGIIVKAYPNNALASRRLRGP